MKKKIYYFLLRIKRGEIKFRRFLGGEGAVVKRRLRNENVGRGSLKLISIFGRLKFILLDSRVINTNITLTRRIYNFRNSIDPSNAICRPLKLRGKLIGEDLGGKTDNDFFRILVINGFYAFGHGLVVDVTVRELKFIKLLKMHIYTRCG